MTSPDVTRYSDLTVFDENSEIVFNEILQAARSLLPEWVPKPGQIEVILAEVFAQRTVEVVRAVNRVPGAVVETLLELFGVFRNLGDKASASADFVFLATGVIPAGTRFLYQDSINRISAAFVLTEDVSSSGAGTVSATLEAESGGASFNVRGSGRQLVPLVKIPVLQTVTFTDNPRGGSDTESDDDYFARGVSVLGSYTSGLVTDRQIQNFVVNNFVNVNRTRVYSRRKFLDRNTTNPRYTTHDGAALVVVAGEMTHVDTVVSEIAISAEELSQIYDRVNLEVPTVLDIDVASADLVRVNVRATVTPSPGILESQISVLVENVLQDYLNPNTWDLDNQIVPYSSVFALIAGLDEVVGVSRLELSGSTLIGVNSIGASLVSGGSFSTGRIVVSGIPSALHATTIPVGDKFFFTHVLDSGEVEFLTFESMDDYFVGNNGVGFNPIQVVATERSSRYNSVSRGGVVDGTLVRVGGGVGTINTDLSGGSEPREQFVAGADDSFVEQDLVMRNLGTLPVLGSVVVSVE